MIHQYKKRYITEKIFNSIEFKNTTLSQGSVGHLMFDRYLKSKGFLVKGIRNAYHPESLFFNPNTNEAIFINFGIEFNKQKRDFYIDGIGNAYEVPQTEEDIKLFEDGFLKIMFS